MKLRWRRNSNWCVAINNDGFPALNSKKYPEWIWRFWYRVNGWEYKL